MSPFHVLRQIEELSPAPAVRYRIKRLLNQEVDPQLWEAFYHSKWVEMLKANRQEDGGYGRFHTRNSKTRQKYPTTEIAIDSMDMLGIRRGNPLADRLCDYLEGILKKEIPWPDGFEKNRWYRAAQPLFTAAKLSVFGSGCREFRKVFEDWRAILQEAFAGGEYDPDKANKASREILGCDIDGSYIGLHSVYPIQLLTNMQAEIHPELKRNYLKWLHHSGQTIGYTDVILSRGLFNSFSRLYRVYFLLSGFSCFKEEFEEELEALLEMRDPEGLWNFGKDFSCQKFSDDWKSRERMMTDHTLAALLLFK